MTRLYIYILILLSFSIKASHISGGQITYQSLGGNFYAVKLTYFWDCQGGFNPGTQQTIDIDGCGTSLTMIVLQSTLTPGDGVLADGLCPNSGLGTCKRRIEYVGAVQLPSACNDWVFSIGSCCRGGNFTNITNGTGASYYHFATLNNVVAPQNNSPDISIGTLPNFCVNQPACFNLGATERDGHTLSYSFIDAYQTATTFVTYAAGFTGASPIAGITINASTGQINFTPTTIGDYVITVLITERDAAGNVVGTIMRDFQAIVTNCNNQGVNCGQGNITNVTSGTIPSGTGNVLQICENIPFCFDVLFTDPDLADSIKVSSPNLATALPGATIIMTYTTGVTNSVKATICWTPPPGSSNRNTGFILIVRDKTCPVPAETILNYFIDVLPATSAGPDVTICGTQSASLNAVGSSTVFSWSDLSGTLMPVGPEFSCNPCANPVLKPAVTSTYVVTNVGGGLNCKNKDTIIVNVAPDFTLTAGSLIANACLNTAVQFTSSVDPVAGVYSYTWSPTTALTTTNTANTTAVFSTAGSYNYTLTSVSSLGCKKQSSSIPFTVQPVITPVFTVVPTNTVICGNRNVPLSINFANSTPTSCGLSPIGCATTNLITIGNGFQTNGTTSFPTPYSNYWKSQHFQILYTSTELLAAGVVPGKLSSIAFNIATLNSFNTALPNYTIKIKCTSATNATTFDNVGLTQVFFANNYMPTTGWNTHTFTQAYEWSGNTNILIDVCYDMISSGFVSDGSTGAPYTTTPHTSVIYSYSDTQDLCSNSVSTNTSTRRPNSRFGNCTSVPPPSYFSYSWLPTTGLSSASVSNPTANITSSIQYSVIVTPTAAATCSNINTASITVITPVTPTITSVPPLCNNTVAFTLTATPTGGSWSGTGVNAAGLFTPSLALTGNNTYTYSVGTSTCSAKETTTINVVQFVPATITGTVGPYCVYDLREDLQAVAQFTGGVWSGTGVVGTFFDPVLAGVGTHSVVYVTDPLPTGLCPDDDTLVVLVNPKPEVNALSDITDGCNPVNVNFYTNSTVTGAASWNFGDGATGSGLSTNHLYTTPGTYTAIITYTDVAGCIDTTSILRAITVYSVPVASFNPSLLETTVVDGQIDFTNNSTVLAGNTYVWDVGGLATSNSVNTSYLFNNAGNFVVTLTATSTDGCVDDTSVVVKVNPDVVLYVPNAFTPGNNDGLNDVFEIFLPQTGVDYSTFSLTIFDRWGEMVYKTNDVTKFWNGAKNNSGLILKEDTYVWKISFRDDRRKYYERTGHVTLYKK